jgi:hypothetical protein
LIFKTDVRSRKKVGGLRSICDVNTDITRWSVDTDDIDNVLRVVTIGNLDEDDIIALMKTQGFACEELPD